MVINIGFVAFIFTCGLVIGVLIEGEMKDKKYLDAIRKLNASNKRLQEEINVLLSRKRR